MDFSFLPKPVSLEDFTQIYSLLTQSFPPEEFRGEEPQRKNLDRDEFQTLICRDERGDIAALLTVWNLSGFRYVEHFAVAPTLRSQGLGRQMLFFLQQHSDAPLVLEVEPPETELAARRIGFYKRLEFVLNPYPYLQPPLRRECPAIPLQLMSWPSPLSSGEFEQCRDQLYDVVYTNI